MRLVVNPEKMVIAEARRTYTYLGLFGYRVDAVVVNRIIPEEVNDPYFGKWKDIQAEHLATVARVVRARADPARPGCSTARWSACRCSRRWRPRSTATSTRRAILFHDDPIRVRKHADGYVLSMRLPFVSRDDMDIHRRGDELFVRVGSYKRNLILPQTLKRMVVKEANFAGDHLEITFGRSAVDRRPGVSAVRSSPGAHAVGIDVGGTKIASFLVDRSGAVLDRDVRPTPARRPDSHARRRWWTRHGR